MTTTGRDATSVLVTGASGYIGARLVRTLLERGHQVRAIVRASSVAKLPAACETIIGDVLNTSHIATALGAGDTLVHLVGTPHPSPTKAPLFRSVDLASASASISAARGEGASHLVFVSVAHPAPVMHAYIAARVEAESQLLESGVPGTIVRPWYVLGPGHQWPQVLRPLYALAERVPSLREGARRLGLVTVKEMVATLAWSVAHPPATEHDLSAGSGTMITNRAGAPIRVLEVPDIRRIGRTPSGIQANELSEARATR